MLENFGGADGRWDFLGVLGRPLMDLADDLVDDLETWRYLGGIIQRDIEKEKATEQQETANV